MHYQHRSSPYILLISCLLVIEPCSAQTQNYIAKFGSNGSTTNSTVFDNGSVGIATTTPNAKLEVDSSGQGNVTLQLADAPTTNRFFVLANASDGYGNPLVRPGDQVLGFTGSNIDTGSLDIVPWSASSKGIRIASSGNVGIGTPTPNTELEILNGAAANASGQEVLRLSSLTSGSTLGSGPFIRLDNGLGTEVGRIAAKTESSSYVGLSLFTYNNGSSLEAVRLSGQGNMGIGSTAPRGKLEVDGSLVLAGPNLGGTSLSGWANTSTLVTGTNYSNGATETDLINSGWTDNTAFNFYQVHPNGSVTNVLTLAAYGNVGIGRASPAFPLDVNGTLNTVSVRFPDGSLQGTAWTGVLCGGDYAESVDVSGERTTFEPGDVLVMLAGNGERFAKSSTPYSRMVSGIYSTKPGMVGRRQTSEKKDFEVPMAMIGIVPAKVTAQNGPIETGDLLVTSDLPGYAMKGTEANRMLGAVVGKALGSLQSGKGVIDVLVTLQ